MIVEKLVKSSILNALDLVWSESGIIPSKKTRKTILKAVEKISSDVEGDFKKAQKEQLLNQASWYEETLNIRRRSTVTEVAGNEVVSSF